MTKTPDARRIRANSQTVCNWPRKGVLVQVGTKSTMKRTHPIEIPRSTSPTGH